MSDSTSREPNGGENPDQPNNQPVSDSLETHRGFQQLRDLIDQHFTLEEIQGLCFDLSVEFEHLAGSTRPLKIQNLIAHLGQRQRLPDLLHWLKQQRPQVDWAVAEQADWRPPVESFDFAAVPVHERPSRTPQYLDFEIEVGAGQGREYPVAVIRSPAGEARETMQFPYDELALENRLQSLQIALLHAGGAHRQMLTAEERLVQEFGRDLFNALLTGEMRSRFDVSCTEARTQGKGLRLKLRLQPPELARLPWEFLYDSRRAEYICLSRETPVIRYLELPQSIQPLTVNPPLRILGMAVSPRGLPPLDIDREKQRVDMAVRPLQASGIVQLTWLAGSTWRDLQRAMRAGPWHIFHFIGHGGFDRLADEGFIALANESSDPHRLMATELGRLLADHHSLRMVLLNSCEGARGSQHDVFSSSAAILVRRGLPAVLAMQYAITDRAAIEFARAFYEALTDNLPVDAAVAEARKAVSLAMSYTVEWGTPVLYMRAPQGIIFKIAAAPRPAPIDLTETSSGLEERLEQLYTDGLGAYWVEDWDKACRRFQKILDIKPGYGDTAVRLAAAQRQKKLQILYQQAQAAGENWGAAISALEEIVADAPEYRDAQALLAAARQQKQLADLYAEARRLHGAGQWQAVVNVFGQIRGMEPEYPDSDDLLVNAEQEVAELQRQAELNRLYGRAVRQIDAGEWESARQLLATIVEMEPDYRETKGLLARAEEAAAHVKAEQERQAQVNTWYEQALSLARAGQWPQVLAKMQEIAALDPQFADVEGITERAQAEIEQAESEARRQDVLATLYAEAVRLLKAESYQAALEKWRDVQALDAEYPDRQRVQHTAKKKLKQLSQTAVPRRRWPRKNWLWLGGAGVVVTAVVLLLLLNPFEWGMGNEAAGIVPTASVAACEPEAIYCEDFENGRADDWKLEPGWEVIESSANHYLQGSENSYAFLQHTGWTDYRLRFRFKLDQGRLQLYYRYLPEEKQWYTIGNAEAGNFYLVRVDGEEIVTLANSQSVSIGHVWHDAEVIGEDRKIQVYMDGALILEHEDEYPVLQGTIVFEPLADSQVQIDDVEIWPVYVEFFEPMIDGYRLDLCVTPGAECGEPAATAWCQQQGFFEATDFEEDLNIGAKGLEAITIGSGQIVNVDAFKSITCR
ncbi:MAG: CHAT domain-containing protein [Ardenticatenaceae bacterium]|nr:CHAT domain-containing protein [Ardenticatenaceae bacterium]